MEKRDVNEIDQDIQKVCLLIGHDQLADWKIRAFEKMTEQTGARVSLVVRAHQPADDNSGSEEPSLVDRLSDTMLRPLKSQLASDPKTSTPLSEVAYLREAEYVNCVLTSTGDNRYELPESTIEYISGKTDIVIQFAVGILEGDILTAPKYGVLGYHMADIREYRGSNVTLWMFLDGVESGGVTLQRLTPELDAGHVVLIRETDLSEARSWPEVRERLYATAEEMLADGIERLSDFGFEPQRLSNEELGPLYYRSDVTFSTKLRLLYMSIRYKLI